MNDSELEELKPPLAKHRQALQLTLSLLLAGISNSAPAVSEQSQEAQRLAQVLSTLTGVAPVNPSAVDALLQSAPAEKLSSLRSTLAELEPLTTQANRAAGLYDEQIASQAEALFDFIFSQVLSRPVNSSGETLS